MADEKVPGDHAEQHPALAGDKAEEVSHRSADGSKGQVWRKVFVLGGSVAKDSPQHEANCVRVLEEAIQRGLHPKGKARLVSGDVDTDEHGHTNTTCIYEVPVEPAVTDIEAHKTVTPSSELNEQAAN